MKEKVVLAYSGGLDTSVIVKWLNEEYNLDVIAVCVDVGEVKDLDFIREKALKVGAIKSFVIDARQEFIEDYCFPALSANAMYEGKYPLATALARPLIAKIMIDIANQEGASYVAHGCTGKGNDQVRFDVSFQALRPDIKIIAPQRDKPTTREEAIAYAELHGIPVPVTKKAPWSIDQNLWGRSMECGPMEDAWNEPPEAAYELTQSPLTAPDDPTYIEITFEKGVPVALNGQKMDGLALVTELAHVAGKNGVGRIDHVENRLVGIKSRETYEAPAATVLVMAHRDLEQLTLTREVTHFKTLIEQKYAEMIYFGLWFSPLRDALDGFVKESQRYVNGTVRLKLWKGNCTVVGRKSDNSLYNTHLATYEQGDLFDHTAAKGFIDLWALPTKVASMTYPK